MIYFKLKALNEILPRGTAPEHSLHWFGLTDGDLWLTFGNETIYEYTPEALKSFGNKPTKYNDYQLARFIEDFTELFDAIRETVPSKFYHLTAGLASFRSDAANWLELHDTNDDTFSEFYEKNYEPLISWINSRTLDSGHLKGGPKLSFFRNENNIRVVWETDQELENGIRVWTAKSGGIEMDYAEFLREIKRFGRSFFHEMDKQIKTALEREWGNISSDKERLVEEQENRKAAFFASFQRLEEGMSGKTNWMEIEKLFDHMKSELKAGL